MEVSLASSPLERWLPHSTHSFNRSNSSESAILVIIGDITSFRACMQHVQFGHGMITPEGFFNILRLGCLLNTRLTTTANLWRCEYRIRNVLTELCRVAQRHLLPALPTKPAGGIVFCRMGVIPYVAHVGPRTACT